MTHTRKPQSDEVLAAMRRQLAVRRPGAFYLTGQQMQAFLSVHPEGTFYGVPVRLSR